ncbi:MAG: PAS domain-containing sensor histidine kinase [Bacteroidota bacterium]|nr:PAS domain-containing sensor histidine kinase [Bacteroidota bacterium]
MNAESRKEMDISLNLECPTYMDIFRLSPISIELYDANGILQEVNQACLDLFGIKNKEEVVGYNLFANPNLPHNAIDNLKSGETAQFEYKFDFDLIRSQKLYQTSREGSCYLECCIIPTINESKEIIGYIVYVTEITRRKEAELLQEEQSKELQKLNITKDKFFSIIAHDLKSPFNAIMGFSELMLKNYNDLDDATFIKGLKTIESAGNHAFKLVENLLLWSKNQSKGKNFNPEWLNLNKQVAESLILAESAIQNKELRVNFNQQKTFNIFADRNMIDLVLRNLISNAIKFTNKKGKISITIAEQNQEILTSITDNGIGISENKLATIFDLDKPKNTLGTENEQGTGLGLILCKDFIENHGGKIWVESAPGKGSTFIFSLPQSKTGLLE